jgi:hypothetical protein
MGNEGGIHVAKVLEVNTVLENLDIGESELGHGSLIAVACALMSNETLKRINLDGPTLKTLEVHLIRSIVEAWIYILAYRKKRSSMWAKCCNGTRRWNT